VTRGQGAEAPYSPKSVEKGSSIYYTEKHK